MVLTIRVIVIVLTVASACLLCWVPALRLAIMRRRAQDWALFWVTLVASFVCLSTFRRSLTGTAWSDVGLAVLLLMGAATLTHYLRFDIRHHRASGARQPLASTPISNNTPISHTTPAPAYPAPAFPVTPATDPQHAYLRPQPRTQPPPRPYGGTPDPGLHQELTQPQQAPLSPPMSPHMPPHIAPRSDAARDRQTPPPRPAPARRSTSRARHARPYPSPEQAEAMTVDQAPPIPRAPGPHQPPPPGHPQLQPRPGRPQRIDQVRAELDELSDLLRREPRGSGEHDR
ncbi:hypothetical protein ACFQ2B_19160 [Streptomyces stramineus]